MENFDVMVIGGGITGAGITRDLSLRGLNVIMVEKSDLCSGTTGRSHGLLHSGGRYAVKDQESAIECIQENKILRKVASYAIEECGGMFVSVTDEDSEYKEQFLKGCKECGIPTEEINPKEALKLEPFLNPDIIDCILVPDGSVDPFSLVLGNVLSARENNAIIKTYTEVTGFNIDDNVIRSVEVRDKRNGKREDIKAEIVVNASGPWVKKIGDLLGVNIPAAPNKGTMLIMGQRTNMRAINRLRFPSDGDIIVPHHTVDIIGTTSIDVTEVEKYPVEKDEVQLLINEGAVMIPIIREVRYIRAFAGVRPLFGPGEETGREVSRTFKVLDHSDKIENFLTIAGGKLTSYRLMAEKLSDIVCEKLGVSTKCTTHKEVIEEISKEEIRERTFFDMIQRRAISKYGSRAKEILDLSRKDKIYAKIICPCEFVLRGEVVYAGKNFIAHNIGDIRRRTRAGLGMCQGGFCYYKVAQALVEDLDFDIIDAHKDLLKALSERYKGVKPILWGDQLKQQKLVEALYFCVGNYDNFENLFKLGEKR